VQADIDERRQLERFFVGSEVPVFQALTLE
jgi:hypothetical protein